MKEKERHFEKVLATLSRILVWVMIFLICYLLRSFFLLIFLTFVFAYIQAKSVQRLTPCIRNRPMRVVVVGLLFLGLIVGLISFLSPQIKTQAGLFVSKLPAYLETIDSKLSALAVLHPFVKEVVPQISLEKTESGFSFKDVLPFGEKHEAGWNPQTSPSAMFLMDIMGIGERSKGIEHLKETIDLVRHFGELVAGVVSAFLLSLLFSFLIVLDLPRLTKLVESLRFSKLSFVYSETAPSIVSFGTVLGRALEAQAMIALINTLLTALALYILGLTGKIAFLSLIVFLFSFVPVAGVFISSVPICIVALQESGFGLVFGAIGAVTIIHLIEAYILNPKIYGHHLHLNPVVVLIILTIAGKLVGGWGLILGVPVCTYIFGYAIQAKEAPKQSRTGS